MILVQRCPILITARIESGAAGLLRLLVLVMTRLRHRLEVVFFPKESRVATVRNNVINNRCRHLLPHVMRTLAKRVSRELASPEFPPPRSLVQ